MTGLQPTSTAHASALTPNVGSCSHHLLLILLASACIHTGGIAASVVKPPATKISRGARLASSERLVDGKASAQKLVQTARQVATKVVPQGKSVVSDVRHAHAGNEVPEPGMPTPKLSATKAVSRRESPPAKVKLSMPPGLRLSNAPVAGTELEAGAQVFKAPAGKVVAMAGSPIPKTPAAKASPQRESSSREATAAKMAAASGPGPSKGPAMKVAPKVKPVAKVVSKSMTPTSKALLAKPAFSTEPSPPDAKTPTAVVAPGPGPSNASAAKVAPKVITPALKAPVVNMVPIAGTPPLKVPTSKAKPKGEPPPPEAPATNAAAPARKAPVAKVGPAAASSTPKSPAMKVATAKPATAADINGSKASALNKVPATNAAAPAFKVPVAKVGPGAASSAPKSPAMKVATAKSATAADINGSTSSALSKAMPEASYVVKPSGAVSNANPLGQIKLSPDHGRVPSPSEKRKLRLHFSEAALQSSQIDVSRVCPSRSSCGQAQEAKRGWQYSLNNLLLCLKVAAASPTGAQPPKLQKALRKAIVSVRNLDADGADASTLERTAGAIQRLFYPSVRQWLQSTPASVMSFSGTHPSMKIPTGTAQIVARLASGQAMPVIGFGTRCVPAARLRQALRWALETGYRRLDLTAGTLMEIAAAQAIARHITEAGVDRESLFVKTSPREMVWERPSDLKVMLAAQLQTLHVAYVDLYLLQGPAPSLEALKRMWREFEALYDSQKARSIGVANISITQLGDLLATSRIKPHIVQDSYTIYSSFDSAEHRDKDVIDSVLRPKNILVLADGLLSGGQEMLMPLNDPHVRAIAESHGRSPALILLRWALQRGMMILPCSSEADHIRDNMDVFSFELPEYDMAVLSNLALLAQTIPGTAHRPTWKLDVFGLAQASEQFT